MDVRTHMFVLLLLTDVAVVVFSGEGLPCPVHYTRADLITNCSHLHLTSLPDTVRRDTTWLDLSHNQLTSLQELSSVHLPKLRHLDVSHNSVQELDQQALSGLTTLHSVDLSHNQLTVISDRAFVHLTALTSLKLNHNGLNDTVSAEVFLGLSHLSHLNLSYNQLHVLHNAIFSHLPQLTWLSLRSNRLHKLQVGAMLGLHKLTYLDLTFNQLQMTSQSLPPGVFAPLSTLHSLRLHNNDDSHVGQYPPDVFNDLVSLRYLAPDTFSTVHFGPDFAALRQLEVLDFSENCRIVRLTNNSFEGFKFSSLHSIFLTSCKRLIKIELCVFCNFPNLDILQIKWARYMPVTTTLMSLYGLRGQNMTDIDFSYNGFWVMNFHIIDRDAAKYLADICVTNFTVSNSQIRKIYPNSIPMRTSLFSKCIENLDLTANSIVGDVRFFLLAFINFHHLHTLQIQDQELFSVRHSACILASKCQDFTDSASNSILFSESTLSIPIPPTLVELNVAAVFDHLSPLPTYIEFHSGRELRTLDLSYNGLTNCVTTILGLDRLVTLRLNFNYCHNLSHTIFDHLHSLRHLELSNFGPRTSFYVSQGKRLFHNLTQLETLDLSFNDLHRLDPTMLERQPRLTSLDLSRNRFQFVPVHLSYHGNLSFLDLSHNSIPSLTSGERDVLDRLAIHHHISVSLVGNPLTCTCADLDMVEWLRHTSTFLDGEGQGANYTCTTETGEVTNTYRVMAEMTSHWRRCVGVRMFGLALGLFLTQMLLTLTAYIIYRNWSHLLYAWKALRRHQLPHRLRDFTKDVYFVYADTDRDVMWACLTLTALLRQHGALRILLRNQEEVAGSDKAESIAQHIETSWKTMLLVTRDFCQDEWACGFSVKQALRHINDDTPDRVIVLFLERARVLRAMPSLQMVLRVVPERNVFHVHPDTPAQHPVWQALAEAVTG